MSNTDPLQARSYSAHITIDDSLARKLLRKADEDDCPIAGRRFEIQQMVGSMYGVTLYAGTPTTKGGTRLILVCKPGSAVTYTEDDL